MADVARNMVLEGKYQYKRITLKGFWNPVVCIDGQELPPTDVDEMVWIDGQSITETTEQHKHAGRRALIGGVLLGPIGAIAGAASAKSKQSVKKTGEINVILIRWHDKTESTAEVCMEIYAAMRKWYDFA